MIHPLEKFKYCPKCGSANFAINNVKSKKCSNCGFVYYLNPSAANVAFILNDKEELLVVRRLKDPQKGTLDLPGGFTDSDETGEEGVIREVKEETALEVISIKYLFSLPNHYLYCGLDIPTLDMFFLCEVKDLSLLQAGDDAGDTKWIPLESIRVEEFGLDSIRKGLQMFLDQYTKSSLI